MKKLLFYVLLLIGSSTYAQIVANDDTFYIPSFALGSIGNVLSNDTIDGTPITNPSDVVLTFDNSLAPSITIDSSGNVMFFGAPSGLYFVNYTICRTINPTECESGSVSIYVNSTINAVDDLFVLASSGSATPSVLTNDTRDGLPIGPFEVLVTAYSSIPTLGITIQPDGSILVASYVPVGTYNITYQICDSSAYTPSCDTAIVSIEVLSSTSTGMIGDNISTGIDLFGNPLPDSAVDPFWKITSSPNPPGTPAIVQYSYPIVWEPTPVALTNARWINASGNFNDLPGNYTFEREIDVPIGTTSLLFDYTASWDDTFISMEIVRPDMSTIPITPVPTGIWQLTAPISYSEINPMPGTWRVRVVTNFYDSIGAFILSGYAHLNCQILYVDADNDGYDNGTFVNCSSTIPTGYSLTTLGSDCDDSNSLIHPTSPEICYDGIDNNCDGTVDEGCIPIVTQLRSSFCGSTLTGLNQLLVANVIPGITVTRYRFRITKMIGGLPSTLPADRMELPRTGNTFQLTMLGSIAYNTSYQVEVAVEYLSVWQPYGSPCIITTPNFLTKVRSAQCGSTVSAMSTLIYADNVNYVDCYVFKVTNTTTLISQTYTNCSARQFRMSDLTSPPADYGTTYTVEVALINYDGTTSAFGIPCTITTPSSKRVSSTPIATQPFEAIAYPNPAVDNFQIEVSTESKEPIFIQVYDLLGRLVEDKQTTIDELYQLQLGKSYPSGLYQVIVKQESNTKSLKVIKR